MSDEERVGAILDAAYVCFTRHGVRRTTMDDIAREHLALYTAAAVGSRRG